MPDRLPTSASKTATLIITSISQFLAPIMGSSITVALPSIGAEFQAEAVLLGWITSIYLLAATVLLIPVGRAADIYGRKRIFSYGIWLFTISSILGGFSSSATMLILCRALQGIGSGMTFGTSVAILTSVFPPEERGKALGINTAAVYLGLSLGPFLGGVLTQHLTWRSIFFVSALLSLAVAVLVLWRLKGEWAEAKGEKFDFIGSIIFTISLFLTLYGFSSLPSWQGLAMLILGILGMVAFVIRVQKSASPLLDITLIRKNTLFVFSCLATLVNYSATFAVAFLLSLYLQYNKGFSPQIAGLILVAQPVVQTIFAPISGRFSDKFLPQRVAAFGIAVTCVGLLLLIFFTYATALWFILASLAVLGFGYGFFSTPNAHAVMNSVEKKFLAVAAGTQSTMRHGGMVFSMGIVMILFTIYMGNVQITPEYYSSFLLSQRTTFIIFAVLSLGSIFLQLSGSKGKK